MVLHIAGSVSYIKVRWLYIQSQLVIDEQYQLFSLYLASWCTPQHSESHLSSGESIFESWDQKKEVYVHKFSLNETNATPPLLSDCDIKNNIYTTVYKFLIEKSWYVRISESA